MVLKEERASIVQLAALPRSCSRRRIHAKASTKLKNYPPSAGGLAAPEPR